LLVLVGASHGQVVIRLLPAVGDEPRVHAQPADGVVELGDAVGGERRLPEHAHPRKVRRQRVEDVVVAEAAVARAVAVARVAIRHATDEAPLGPQQLAQRRQRQAPRPAQERGGVGHDHHLERSALAQRRRRHEAQPGTRQSAPRPVERGGIIVAAEHRAGTEAEQVRRTLAAASPELQHPAPFDEGPEIAVDRQAVMQGGLGHARAGIYPKRPGDQPLVDPYA
jgi:hypothetical protein